MLDAYEGTIDADGSETIDDARNEVGGYFAPERRPMPSTASSRSTATCPSPRCSLPPRGAAVHRLRHDGRRAKGRGLATALTGLSLASLEAAGEPQVHLWVTRGNDHAERIYERLGFRDMSG